MCMCIIEIEINLKYNLSKYFVSVKEMFQHLLEYFQTS